jgi:hypothetical protein
LASLFIGHAAQKSKLHNLQYDEGGNQMAETEKHRQNIGITVSDPIFDSRFFFFFFIV